MLLVGPSLALGDVTLVQKYEATDLGARNNTTFLLPLESKATTFTMLVSEDP